MPFTPFHFGPSTVVGMSLHRHLDPFTFVLANVAIDVEPLSVMVLHVPYPLHGHAHTLLGGAAVGCVWGVLVWLSRSAIQRPLCGRFGVPFLSSTGRLIASGILGTWFHVLLDAPLYRDIRPFFPFDANPLYGLVGRGQMYCLCALCLVPAAVLCAYLALRMQVGSTQDDDSVSGQNGIGGQAD